jgi:adenine deaminase
MKQSNFSIKGNIVDIRREKIFAGELIVENGKVNNIISSSNEKDNSLPYILPGFIDSHVHIESSMLVPSEFARLAVTHGTIATVSDPHEIANVCGKEGVRFMIDNGNTVNFKFYFGAPSCVPATSFETAGANVGANDVTELLAKKEIHYLSEMMNFPGVINGDTEVMKKIAAAHEAKKPVDGHAPGLRGEGLKKYVAAGISTDHECFTKEEALEKLSLGMKILIREGSAAKNFEALADLLHDHSQNMMFCSDDKHPDSLVKGHINELCSRAVKKGIAVFKVLRAACINPVVHYQLETGTLAINDPADFIIVKNLEDFEVIETFINGTSVAENGRPKILSVKTKSINRFHAEPLPAEKLKCQPEHHLLNNKLPVIEALDGQLITNKLLVDPLINHNELIADVKNDILKLVVVNRYQKAAPAIAFIKNFGLQQGAIASSVAHDSHNIIAVGADDESLAKAINLVIKEKGGVSCVSENNEEILPLPVAGLMSTEDGYKVAGAYSNIDKMAKTLGSPLSSPFMTLSFMALLVIPSLKLSDKGLFDGDNFEFLL